MSKYNLLYDATNLVNEFSSDFIRSGIFFVTKNLFNQFLVRDDINLYLYCDLTKLPLLKKYLQLNNLIGKIEIYNEDAYNFLHRFKFFLRELKSKTSKQEHGIKRIFISILYGIVSKLSKIYDDLYVYPIIHEKLKKIDLYFSPNAKTPEIIRKTKNIKSAVLLYDVIPLILDEYKNELCIRNNWFQELIKSLNKNEYYFAISESTKRDFLKYCPNIDKEKIHTALLACDERFKPESEERIKEIRKKYNIPEDKKYIFSLCTLEPRKNLKMAVKSFIEFIKKNKAEDIVYVLGGGHWEKFINELKEGEEKLGEYKEKIIRAGYIEDEDLMGLYTGAQWFVYTSKYEGFGLPPLEAMSCGCPVITSNNSSLPEVVADAGIMIDYDSEEEHIEAYEKFYYNEEERKEYKRRGLERAREFSWKKCADIIINELTKEDKIHD